MINKYAKPVSPTQWEITTPLIENGSWGTPLETVALENMHRVPDNYSKLFNAFEQILASYDNYDYRFKYNCFDNSSVFVSVCHNGHCYRHFQLKWEDYKLEGNIITVLSDASPIKPKL